MAKRLYYRNIKYFTSNIKNFTFLKIQYKSTLNLHLLYIWIYILLSNIYPIYLLSYILLYPIWIYILLCYIYIYPIYPIIFYHIILYTYIYIYIYIYIHKLVLYIYVNYIIYIHRYEYMNYIYIYIYIHIYLVLKECKNLSNKLCVFWSRTGFTSFTFTKSFRAAFTWSLLLVETTYPIVNMSKVINKEATAT